MNGLKKLVFERLTLMKLSPIQPDRLSTCPLGDFDMLKSNLTSETFLFATQTSKLRKTISILFFNSFAGLFPINPFKGPDYLQIISPGTSHDAEPRDAESLPSSLSGEVVGWGWWRWWVAYLALEKKLIGGVRPF